MEAAHSRSTSGILGDSPRILSNSDVSSQTRSSHQLNSHSAGKNAIKRIAQSVVSDMAGIYSWGVAVSIGFAKYTKGPRAENCGASSQEMRGQRNCLLFLTKFVDFATRDNR